MPKKGPVTFKPSDCPKNECDKPIHKHRKKIAEFRFGPKNAILK